MCVLCVCAFVCVYYVHLCMCVCVCVYMFRVVHPTKLDHCCIQCQVDLLSIEVPGDRNPSWLVCAVYTTLWLLGNPRGVPLELFFTYICHVEFAL